MPQKFKLLELNPQLTLRSEIYQDGGEIFRDSTLSNYLQIAVAEVFTKANDKSLFSLDIEHLCQTPELQRALSTSTFRFLEALDLSQVNTALDLSEDFGGVAHYLAGQVAQVESVKVDPDLCRLATTRCANKRNACHISEDLDKLNFPDNHYDLIVVGQLENLSLGDVELAALLVKLNRSLSENGVLLVNALNRNRLSRWLDSSNRVSESQLPFADLYRKPSGENNEDAVLEIDRMDFRSSLLAADFPAVDFHAAFSSGGDCKNLFSEDYLYSSVNGLNHFYRLGSFDNAEINEFLLYRSLVAQKRNLVDCANRFVILAAKNLPSVRGVYDNDFSHFPGQGRKPEWRTATYRSRTAQQVEKCRSYPEQQQNSKIITQNLQPQPFYKGRVLIADWLEALQENDHVRFEKLVDEYLAWLNAFAETDEFQVQAYDLLPFNIVLNERGDQREFQAIDTEWQVHQKFSAEFVLFRALFWLAFQNRALLNNYAKKFDIFSIGMFVVQHMPSVHQIEDLAEFVQLEEQLQAEISSSFRADSVAQALLQNIDSSVIGACESPLNLSLVWGDSKGVMNEEHMVSEAWARTTQPQDYRLTLPAYNPSSSVLRIDPMAEPGAFKLAELELTDASGKVVWRTESLNGLASSGIRLEGDLCIAIDDDPYFLIDCGSIEKIETASQLRLRLEWVWGDNHSLALKSLGSAVASQNAAIMGQSHRINALRADKEYQEIRIEDLLGHRTDLTEMLKKEEQRASSDQARLNDQITHLQARLHAQHARNDELHGFLLMRPSTRIKRITRRWLNKLTGKPTLPPTPPPPPEEEVPAEPVIEAHGELLGQNLEDYGLWVSENDLNEQEIEAAKAEIEQMAVKPVFSILVPIYNTDPEYLIPMIRSVQRQIYPHWQLCLVDDCSPKSYLKQILKHESLQDDRIHIRLNEVNQGISVTTNDALAIATGDYIALLDHDDEISIDALYQNAKIINSTPEAGLIYSDEDKMDLVGNRLEPFFKPDYSPDLLDTNNYVCHFSVIKKSLIDQIGGFREGLDGSQDHDIILRAADAAERVVHIPRILYHWRKIPGSTAVEYDSKSYAWEAGRKSVEDHLSKKESGARVELGSLKGSYRVFREIKDNPKVSIVIPFKDKPELLDACLGSILKRTNYDNYEIVGVCNNSEQEETFAAMKRFTESDSRVRFVEKNIAFNYSAICNYGVEQATGEYIVLLNNDIEIINPDWLERLLEHAQRDDIGAVGGKLLYPDGRIQHAGIVVGMVGAAGHPHKFFPDNHIGYHGRLHMVYNVSAVTGAMLMVNKAKYLEVGGLDEENLAVAYNDVDLCLKLLGKGYYNLFTPHAKAIHYESLTRGYEDTDEKMQRLLKEQKHFLATWADFIEQGDPYYNPNLSLKTENFSLSFKD